MKEKIKIIFKKLFSFISLWAKFFVLFLLLEMIYSMFFEMKCFYGIVPCSESLFSFYDLISLIFSAILAFLYPKFRNPHIEKILHFSVLFFIFYFLLLLMLIIVDYDFSTFSSFSLVLVSFGFLIFSGITTIVYLRFEHKFRNLGKLFLRFLKMGLKLLGIFLGSFFILILPFSLLIFLLSILIPSFSEFYWRNVVMSGWIILIFTTLLTLLYYFSARLRKIFKPLLIINSSLLFTILGLRIFLFLPLIFKDNALEPYLKDGQYIIVQKIDKTIKRGSIVAFRSPEGRVSLSIVFALSGEKAAVKNGVLYVNDQLFRGIQYNWDNCFIDSEIKIPEDYFLYVSTNMDCSTPQFDISQWIAHKSQIIGKLLFKAKID